MAQPTWLCWPPWGAFLPGTAILRTSSLPLLKGNFIWAQTGSDKLGSLVFSAISGEVAVMSFNNPACPCFPRWNSSLLNVLCFFLQISSHLILTAVLMVLSSSSIYSLVNRGSERLSDLPKITQLASSKVGIWPRSDSKSTHLVCLLIHFLVRSISQPNWYDHLILSLLKNGTSLISQQVLFIL